MDRGIGFKEISQVARKMVKTANPSLKKKYYFFNEKPKKICSLDWRNISPIAKSISREEVYFDTWIFKRNKVLVTQV